MKIQYKILILILTFGISNLTFGQKTQIMPNKELREIIELAINFPELEKYFSIDLHPERLPIKFKEFGEINSTNLSGIKKCETEIQILKNEEILQKEISDYLNVGDWTYLGDKLRLQLEYPIEGITANFVLERVKTKWKIVSFELWEE